MLALPTAHCTPARVADLLLARAFTIQHFTARPLRPHVHCDETLIALPVREKRVGGQRISSLASLRL